MDGFKFTGEGVIQSITPSKKNAAQSYVEIAYMGGSYGVPVPTEKANMFQEGQRVQIEGPMTIRENRFGINLRLDGQEIASVSTSTSGRRAATSDSA